MNDAVHTPACPMKEWVSPSKPLRVAIRPAYVSKLKQIAALTDASVEALVNQAVSDLLESA